MNRSGFINNETATEYPEDIKLLILHIISYFHPLSSKRDYCLSKVSEPALWTFDLLAPSNFS